MDPKSAQVRNKLKLKNLQLKEEFDKHHQKAKEVLGKSGIDLGKIREHSAKLIGTASLTGTLLLAPPATDKMLPTSTQGAIVNQESTNLPAVLPDKYLTDKLIEILPDNIRPLERDEEKKLEMLFSDVLGIKAKASLEGEHLNTTYGKIGAEQHLLRYPGDSLAQHTPDEGDYGGGNPDEILKEGIAPGLGAWGYFAPSRSEFTQELEDTERWYAVVQTLYLPDWNTRTRYLRDWYKYRKVLIVNTENGKAVVASIADSGPAAWTGKQYGGSPEVMDYLGGPRYKKGPVVVFFVDDPDNEIPLGPVQYNAKIINNKA